MHNARVLAANQGSGDATHSPWPFRADYRSGEGRGDVSGNMTYVLRLYDWLLSRGYEEFAARRHSLWQWIKRHQIPSAAVDGALFAQFFEDHETPTNRTAWAPLNLARYLLEQRDLLDADWRDACGTLVDFVRTTFTHREFGVTVCHEQDEDDQAWGGVVSTYGAVLALYAKETASASLAERSPAGPGFHALFDRRAGPPARPIQERRAGRLAGGCPHRRHSQLRRCAARFSRMGISRRPVLAHGLLVILI